MYAICIHGNKIMASTMNTNVDIPTTLPAPNEEYDNFHTTDLYAMMMMQTELQIHAFNIKAPMVLTNNNLDCVFAFEFEVETTHEFAYFIGCVTLATGMWRWCIPFFVTDDDHNIDNFQVHAFNANPNTVTVTYACFMGGDDIDYDRLLIAPSPVTRTDHLYLCAEEFNVLTGTSRTRMDKNRMPILRFFEFASDENAAGIVYQFAQTEDWLRELITFIN